MSNSGFLWTDPGLASVTTANPGGPYVHVASFRLGSAFGYTPSRSQTSLHGTVLYTGVPATYTVVADDTIDVILGVEVNIGDFSFGEVGLYDDANVLIATCVFDSLQEKVRAVGNQAGNRYRIHARLKLAQAPAVCVVQVSNGLSLLELPAWQNLAAPVDQLNNANAVIVHEKNVSGNSVLLYREGDFEWSPVGYVKIFSGNFSDAGSSATTTTATASLLSAVSIKLPRTDSRYLIKFSNGLVRRLSSQSSATQVTWTPGLGLAPTGAFTIWEDIASRTNVLIPIANMSDYNALAVSFNRYWSTPSGAYSATNAGINQVAIPLLSQAPTLSDWTLISSSLRKLLTLQNYFAVDLNKAIDNAWVLDPTNQTTDGLYVLNRKFGAMYDLINTSLDASRNTVAFPQLESAVVPSLARSRTLPWLTSVVYDFTVDQSDENTRLGLANAGGTISITGASGNQSTFFTGWATLYSQIGSIFIDRGTTTSTNAAGTASAFGMANMDATLRQLYTHSFVITALSSTATLLLQGQTIGNGKYQFKLTLSMSGSPYSVATAGTMSISVSARRPLTTLINNPSFAYYTGTQLASSTF